MGVAEDCILFYHVLFVESPAWIWWWGQESSSSALLAAVLSWPQTLAGEDGTQPDHPI